jgi:predicted MFS family arabinose efflux permease
VSYAAATTMQVDLAPARELPFVFLITGVWALCAHLAGPVAAEWLHAELGFRAVGYGAAAVSLLAAVNFLLLPDPHVRNEAGAAPPPAMEIFRFMSERNILPVLLFNLIEVASYTAVATFIIVFCRTKGMESGRAFFIAYPLMAIVLRLSAGRAQERFGEHTVIYGTMVFYVMSIALVPLIGTPWQLFLVGLGFGAGVTYVNPLLNALAIGRAKNPAYSGRITAWFIWAWCLGGTLSPVIYGYVAQRWGYTVMFVSVAAVLFSGNVIFWWNERNPPVPAGQL